MEATQLIAVVVDAGACCLVGGNDCGSCEMVGVSGIYSDFFHRVYSGCQDYIPVFIGIGIDTYFHIGEYIDFFGESH